MAIDEKALIKAKRIECGLGVFSLSLQCYVFSGLCHQLAEVFVCFAV